MAWSRHEEEPWLDARAFASGGLTARGSLDVSRASKKPGTLLAHGSWFAAGAVLPPDNYLDEGTDLPRSARPMGAIVGTKKSLLLI